MFSVMKKYPNLFNFLCVRFLNPTGSYAQDATELEKLGQMFENMKAKFTQDLSEMMNNQDLTNQAQ